MNELNMKKDDGAGATASSTADHFIIKDGIEYSGTHLIIDLWGVYRLDDAQYIEKVLTQCVEACGANLLHLHVHQFSSSGGISGVAVLAESHISVHTWPERNYAAFDVFMCGDAKPLKAVDVLSKAFNPQQLKVNEILRGHQDDESVC